MHAKATHRHEHHTQRPSARVRTRRAAGAAMGLMGCVLLPLIVWGVAPFRVAFDAMLYHAAAIRAFASQWPDCNVFDYLSATTPGYHLVLAGVGALLGPSVGLPHTALALTGSIFTLALAGLLASACAARAGSNALGVLLAMLVMGSVYVVWPGAALLPDNAGWVLVLAQVLLATTLARTHQPARVLGLACAFGACFLACVLTRQSHAWTAGLLIAGAWLGPGSHDLARTRLRAFFLPTRARLVRLALAAWVLVPGVLALGLFVSLWEGLVPPRFAGQYPPKAFSDVLLSPAWVFVLAVVGMFSPFFGGFAWAGLRQWWVRQRGLLLALVAMCVVLACVPPTTYSFDDGRRSGLWNIAMRLPSLAHVSPFMVALATCGFVLLLGILRGCTRESRWMLALSLLGFSCALSASNELWQRYAEPLVLIVLVLASAETLCASRVVNVQFFMRAKPPGRVSQCITASRGPALVLLALAMVSLSVLLTLRTGKDMRGDNPPTRTGAVHQGGTPPVELPPLPRDGRSLWDPLARLRESLAARMKGA